MKNEIKVLCDTLYDVCELKSDIQIDEYIDVVGKLNKYKSIEVLRCMFRCFRDKDAGEVQYELVEACEQYPDKEYVDVFIDESKTFYESSPEWFGLMFQSILNTQGTLNEFLINLNVRNREKKIFFKRLVLELSQETSKYTQIVSQIK